MQTENQKMALMAIADHLEYNVKNRHFNIYRWKCGTIGCAIGHTIHLLPGLELVPCPETAEELMPYSAATGNDKFQAVADELGLTFEEAKWLFHGESYHGAQLANREDVFKRTRAFAKGEVEAPRDAYCNG